MEEKQKIKIFLSCPILTVSGYGMHSRFIYRALKSREDLFDLYVMPTPWGRCRWQMTWNKEREELEQIFRKTVMYFEQGQGKPSFDVSVQVKIPNEWQILAPINIGVTSGIETTKCCPTWNQYANQMDLVIVESNHAKDCFDSIVPFEVISFPQRYFEHQKEMDLELETDFNFLTVSHMIPRKNVEELIVSFVEEFKNDKNVGLIMKLGLGQDSLKNKEEIERKIEILLKPFSDRKCKLYLLFGDLKKEEL